MWSLKYEDKVSSLSRDTLVCHVSCSVLVRFIFTWGKDIGKTA